MGAFVIAIVYFSLAPGPDDEEVVTGTGDKIALVELKGEIIESSDIVRQIKKYREESDIKGILLRVDSPGGGVVASHEIYEEVRKTRDEGKPIVVSMGSLAASGGYYVSVGASRIVANPGTLTGSIGVISEFMRYDPLLSKIGVEETTIKSGKLKDAGSPYREMTEEDKEYFQSLMDDVHRQFIAIVEKERKLDHDSLLAFADGRVFTGEQAKKLKLVDTLGTFEDAITITSRLSGIRGKAAIVHEEKHKHGLLDLLLGETRVSGLDKLQAEFLHQPLLQYKMGHGY